MRLQPVKTTPSAIVGFAATSALETMEPKLWPTNTIFLGLDLAADGSRDPDLIN